MGLAEQIIITFVVGFFAGYLFRTYKLKQQLVDPKEYKKMIEDFGLVAPFRKTTNIELLVKILIVLTVILAIYYSFGAPV